MSKLFVFVMILGFLPLVKAAMTDSIYLHGAITNTYKNAKYVSIKDTFDQEYLLPISLLEKKIGRKVSGVKNPATLYFFEMTSSEYQSMTIDCHKEIVTKGTKLGPNRCPPAL